MHKKVPIKGEPSHRHSERVLLKIPIEVNGTEVEGKPFLEKTVTIVVNSRGARIALEHSPRPDTQVTITNLQTRKSCLFRVVNRLGKSFSGGAEWGVECLQPETNIWGIYFPAKATPTSIAESVDVLLECRSCGSRELAQLALDQYRLLGEQSFLERDCKRCAKPTEWGFGFVQAEETAAAQAAQVSQPSPRSGVETARAKRLTVKLPVRIRLEDGREEEARTENLSKTGVCFVSSAGMREGDIIRVTVDYTPGSSQPEILARIVWRREFEGEGKAVYGVRFEAES